MNSWDIRSIGVQTGLLSLTLLMFQGVVYCQPIPEITEGGEFCFLDVFEANCTGHGFILMLEANYGRMKLGDCLIDGDVALGCSSDVIDFIDRTCSGRSVCSFRVTQLATISGSSGCSQEVFSYLDAIYTCVDASLGNQQSCDTDQTTYLTGSSGYISSTALETNPIGTTQCTFTVTVLPGQTIDFMIYDFTLKDSGQTCPIDIVFTERRVPNQRTLCNGSLRNRSLFSSRTSRVALHFILNNQNADVPLFFVSYVARGCTTYKAPMNTSVEVEDGYATVTCNFTGDAWTYQCEDTVWVLQEGNTVENCTREIAATRKSTDKEEDSFPWGILIAVGIGIALGTVVGLSLLGLVFLCRKCFCPSKKEPLRPQESFRDQIARDIPPMDELIGEASLMAKQAPTVRRQPSLHYAPQQFGPVSRTVEASIEYNPAGPQPMFMMHPDMRNRAAATLPRPRSVDSMSEHIYEAYKHRAESGSMISESSSAEQLQTLGISSIATATLPLRVGPPVAPKPMVPRQTSVPNSEVSASTSHPVASEETVTDRL